MEDVQLSTSLTPIAEALLLSQKLKKSQSEPNIYPSGRRCLDDHFMMASRYSDKENISPCPVSIKLEMIKSRSVCIKRSSPRDPLDNELDHENLDDGSPLLKKRWRKAKPIIANFYEKRISRTISSSPDGQINMMERETLLPIVSSRQHPDLKVLAPKTISLLLSGHFDDKIAKYVIVDCRFDYEHKGGNIIGSIGLSMPDEVEDYFFRNILEDSTRIAIIFFCEFSSHRAPKMLKHLRNLDRRLHLDSYPDLYYPELYLIDGGYKNCFETYKSICHPQEYVEMQDERFSKECKISSTKLRRGWKRHARMRCVENYRGASK